MNFKFEDYGISTIIVIDDDFNEIDANKLLSDFPADILDILLDGEYEVYKDASINDYIKAKGNKNFIEELRKEMHESNAFSWTNSISKNIKIEKIGVNDLKKLKERLESIDSNDKSRNHLIILDRKLENDIAGVAKDELFKEILKIIQPQISEKNLLLLIYTNEPKPNELKSFEGAKGYLEKLDLGKFESEEMALHFNYVTKSQDLSDDFFENILKSQKANYIKKYNEIFDSSYYKLIERLWELNQNQTLFFYDYLNEGKHADDVIYDIFLAKFNKEYSDEFSKQEMHNAFINPIRRSMQNCVQPNISKKTAIYRTLKELDMGIHFSNRIIKVPDSTDISFGDIIKINEKRYIVLSQDCDTIIRNDFTRNIANFQLAEIKTNTKAITEKELNNFLKNHIKKNLSKVRNVEGDMNEDSSKVERIESYMKDDIIKCALKKYGLNDTEVDHCTDKNISKNNLSDETICNLEYTSEILPENNRIIPIKCIWLDSLVLRNDNKGNLLSKESIENSHEIRYAVKKYMEFELNGLINRVGATTEKTVVEKILKFELDGLNIKCEPQYLDEKLIGFKIENVEREGRLDRLESMRILKSVIEHESRIPDIHTLLI